VTESIADLGEWEVLARLRPFCDPAVGDDAIVCQLPARSDLVVTTDMLVAGVHFSDRTMPPRALGWRAAAANLSDLAAMGAEPLGLTVALGLPPATPWPWLEAVYQGLQACLQRYGGRLLGGDLSCSPVRTLAITALGSVEPGQVIYRHTARPGQVIVSTGVHGAARAGLALLLGELPAIAEPTWIEAHQLPRPRFDAIATLRRLAQQQQICLTEQVAGMDSSDGLANAVVQICRSSGVGAQVVRSQLPTPETLDQAIGGPQAEAWTLYGGEDFELILCLPADLAASLVSNLAGCTIIGQITPGPAIQLVDSLTQTAGEPLGLSQGYQHFAANLTAGGAPDACPPS
jgi:thiamine-monophosphate kinase